MLARVPLGSATIEGSASSIGPRSGPKGGTPIPFANERNGWEHTPNVQMKKDGINILDAPRTQIGVARLVSPTTAIFALVSRITVELSRPGG